MPLARDLANSRYQLGKAKRALYDTHSAALTFCNGMDLGSKAAIATGKFHGINQQSLKRRLNGQVKSGCEDESHMLLIFEEEKQLCNWVKDCGNNMLGRNRDAIAEKVVQILLTQVETL